MDIPVGNGFSLSTGHVLLVSKDKIQIRRV
jgi:hypothetical protein